MYIYVYMCRYVDEGKEEDREIKRFGSVEPGFINVLNVIEG